MDYVFDWEHSNADDEQKNIIIGEDPKTKFVFFKSTRDIENPYFVVECEG
jgi:hypothetical protein